MDELDKERLERLTRMGLGVGLLVLHACSDVNGLLVATALFLIGAPVELLGYAARKKAQD